MLPQRYKSQRSIVWLCGVAASLVLIYTVCLAWMSPAGFPTTRDFHAHMPYLADKPFGEDGFYMLTVAGNIATHGKIEYNRGLATTGIQPLATFVFAGVAWCVHLLGGNEWDFIRWVMVLGALLLILFAFQLARISATLASSATAGAVFALAFLLVLSDYTLFRLATYGLETGIYLCCIALCFSSTQRIAVSQHTSTPEAVWLGMAAGLAGLARIDFGLLFAILLALLLAKRWIGVSNALLSSAITLALVSPWFWFLHHVTGSAVPSSGKAEYALITAGTFWPRLQVMFLMTSSHIAPWSYGGLTPFATMETLPSLLLIAWLFFSAAGKRARQQSPLAFQLAKLWLPSLALLPVIYSIFFFSIWFYYRYTAPLTVVTIPLLAVTLSQIPWVRTHILQVGLALFCFFGVWTTGALHTGHLGNSHTIEAGYIRMHYPSAHVGVFQSGAIGYFNRNVENLDGKMNLPAWNAAQHHQLPAFIDHQGIEVLLDWPSEIAAHLPQSYLTAEWQPCPIPVTGTGSVCLIRNRQPFQQAQP